MTLDELEAMCEGDGWVLLCLSRMARRGTMRLLPRSGPIGEVISGNETRSNVRFDKAAIRRWIAAERRKGNLP